MNEKTKYLWKLVTILAVNLALLVAVLHIEATAEQLGDRGERVAQIRKELLSRKLATGEADGIFDFETRKAISEFQLSAGIKKSGEADYRTLVALGLDTRCSDCFSFQTELVARCIQLSGCLTYPEMLEKGTEIFRETEGALTVGNYIARNYPDFFENSEEPSDDAYNAAIRLQMSARFPL